MKLASETRHKRESGCGVLHPLREISIADLVSQTKLVPLLTDFGHISAYFFYECSFSLIRLIQNEFFERFISRQQPDRTDGPPFLLFLPSLPSSSLFSPPPPPPPLFRRSVRHRHRRRRPRRAAAFHLCARPLRGDAKAVEFREYTEVQNILSEVA